MPVEYNNSLLLLSLLLSLLSGGCSAPPRITTEIPKGFPNHAPEEILRHLQIDSLTTFAAEGSMSLRSPVFSGNVSANIQQRRNDSLFIAFTEPLLGIEAAQVLVTSDSFFYYDKLKSTILHGSIDQAQKVLPLPLTGEGVFQKFLGLPVPDIDTPWTLDANDTHYHLRDANNLYHYIVDPAIWRVVSYEERTSQGTLVESIQYAEFRTIADLLLPQRIALRRPGEDTTVLLQYREMTLNPSQLRMSLRVKEPVEHLFLQ